jgi:uncharacterized protein (DUF2235 family)
LNDGVNQITKYHRGVGTEPRGSRSWWSYWPAHLAELCFGDGIDGTLAELYSWLAAEKRPDDRLFLFGFSRGAFTVRALAGMLHVFGLLKPDQDVTAADVVRLYGESETRIAAERRRLGLPPPFGPCEIDHAAMDPAARDFAARHTQPCAIDFLGLWDTVKAYGWMIPKSFPALRHNTSVRVVRHAVALDERRALFQMTGWASAHIDVKEVWFAGDHSDVGGGHTTGNSALADASLYWMLGEARAAGVHLDPAAKDCITGVERRSADAARTHAKGLWQQCVFFLPGCLPRVELDNHAYPPARPWRVWPFGGRKPGDHAFGSTVFVHHSVDARRLTGVEVCPVADATITWKEATPLNTSR